MQVSYVLKSGWGSNLLASLLLNFKCTLEIYQFLFYYWSGFWNFITVGEASHHVSREQMCVSVTHPLSSTEQALLVKYSQEESILLSHNPESFVWLNLDS